VEKQADDNIRLGAKIEQMIIGTICRTAAKDGTPLPEGCYPRRVSVIPGIMFKKY